jgi:hypothetical protein
MLKITFYLSGIFLCLGYKTAIESFRPLCLKGKGAYPSTCCHASGGQVHHPQGEEGLGKQEVVQEVLFRCSFPPLALTKNVKQTHYTTYSIFSLGNSAFFLNACLYSLLSVVC